MPQLLGLGYLPGGVWSGSLPEPAGLTAAVQRARNTDLTDS